MTTLLENQRSVSFFGRPYFELLRCFGLREEELFGRSVLECPSGPSSFVCEANQHGIEATGVDPVFYRSPDAIETLARSDFREMFARVRKVPERFVSRTYASIDEAERIRLAGLERFLSDYQANYASGRYQVGSLPSLDFEDNAFDMVLCGHLLFLYSEQFDDVFHRAAIKELCRIAAREVRIHPLVGADNEMYPKLNTLIGVASAMGFEHEIVEVDHEFFRGATETLVLRRIR